MTSLPRLNTNALKEIRCAQALGPKRLPDIGQPSKPASVRARRKTVGEKELFSADLSLSVGSPSCSNSKQQHPPLKVSHAHVNHVCV